MRGTGTRKGGPVKMEAETDSPGNIKDVDRHQKPGKQDFPWEPPGRTNPANTFVLDLWLPELCENKFLLF